MRATRPLTCVAGVAAVAGHARARERVDAVIAGAAVGARFWAALVDVCTRRGARGRCHLTRRRGDCELT